MRSRILFAASSVWDEIGARGGIQFDALISNPTFACVKATSRTRAGFVALQGCEAFIKWVDSGSYGRGLLARIFGSRARRALRGSQLLAAAGFAHPQPLLVMETLAVGSVCTSYVLTEPLRAAQVLSRFALGRARPPSLRRTVSQHVGAEIRRLHDVGIYTRDMQETNLMLETRDGELMLYFVDLEDFRRLRKVSMERRMLNLVHLDRSIGRFISRAHRLRFLYDYLGRRPGRAESRQLVRHYGMVRASVERRGERSGHEPDLQCDKA
jgi:tRNA A-37 threonylcarbamoyl transferase component Bud32